MGDVQEARMHVTIVQDTQIRLKNEIKHVALPASIIHPKLNFLADF